MICAYCRLSINSVKYKTHKRKSYHYECFEKLLQGIENAEAQSQTQINASENDALEQYIKDLFNIADLTYLLREQVSQYVSKNGWSPSTIEKVLRYFYEIEKNSPNKEKPSIGIVPYVFEEAKAYYKAIFDLQQEAAGRSVEIKTKNIRMKPPDSSLPMKTNIENL